MSSDKKVLLIFPILEKDKDYHYIPYSSLSLAAPLEHFGLEYDIFDERVDAPAKLYDLLEKTKVAGITMFTGYQTHSGYELLKKIKSFNPKIITVAGGPHVSAAPISTIKDQNVDYVIVGNAEKSFYLFIRDLIELSFLKNSKAIPGLYVEKDGRIEKNQPDKCLDPSFWFPLPFHKIEMTKYINPEAERGIYITQYGCPGLCTFCSTPDTRRLSQKPVSIIKEDLENQLNIYPLKDIWFADATVFYDKQRAHQLFIMISELFEQFEQLSWNADARALEIIRWDIDELKALTKIGHNLDGLVVGLEWGSVFITEKVMRKGKNHLERFATAVKKCHEVGINVTSGLIFGIPGDTADGVYETIRYIERIRKISPNFILSSTFFRPLPKTELFIDLEKERFVQNQSLYEWAQLGANSHYTYNQWMDIPWFEQVETEKYMKAYQAFIDAHGDILI